MAGKAKDSTTGLTANEILFCKEYPVDFNGTQAAIRAGYSKKTAAEQASRLLRKVKVQLYIQAQFKKTADKLEITKERVMQEMANIAFSDVRKLFDDNCKLENIKDLPDEVAAALSSVEIDELFAYGDGGKVQIGVTKKVKLWDKVKALEMFAKHFKIYTDAPTIKTNITLGYGKDE
jgi:phage terminase small subunit